MSIFQKIKSLYFPKKKTLLKMMILGSVSASLFYFQPINNYAQQIERNGEKENTVPEETIVYKKDIYHQHQGNSNGGGCYTTHKTDTRTEEVKCNGTMVYRPQLDSTACNRCGASYYGDHSDRGCWHTETQTITYSYYELGCGKGTSTCLGTLIVKQSTADWTRSLSLTAEYENKGSMKIGDKPYIWNGAAACAENIYLLNQNGTYTVQLNADSYANTRAAMISINVQNIDVTAPVIQSVGKEPETVWTKDGVRLTLTEVMDLQPDGREGCGLHEMPFSYDEGQTWTAENSYFYAENGTYTILVRDRLENISTHAFSFDQIDRTPPTIVSVEYDDTKNLASTEIVVTASDLQPDGREGCGLHEMPYSYDGGKTWTAENTYTVCKNGTVQIIVRDALDNRVTTEQTIRNIDCVGPQINYTMVSDSWTNQDVALYLAASDDNEDGSAGSGLEDAWYSLDGGKSWSNQSPLIFKENTAFTITARDKNNNCTSEEIKIIQIDKGEPWVSLKQELHGSGAHMQVKLIATGGDAYSGVADEGYSWDKGAHYSDEDSLFVTENGLYQVYVKDKAGNCNNAVIEVTVFPALFPELPLIPEETETSQEEPESVEYTMVEEESGETTVTTEETVVTMEERIEAPEEMSVQVIEQDSLWEKVIFFLVLMLGMAGTLLLFLMLWSRTIAVYGKKADGTMQYMGRCFIARKDERYQVIIPDSLVQKAMTMHFRFRPSVLFADAHRGEEMYFLFPEEVCITLTIERNMEME